MKRNVHKIFAIKARHSVDKVNRKREKFGTLLVQVSSPWLSKVTNVPIFPIRNFAIKFGRKGLSL